MLRWFNGESAPENQSEDTETLCLRPPESCLDDVSWGTRRPHDVRVSNCSFCELGCFLFGFFGACSLSRIVWDSRDGNRSNISDLQQISRFRGCRAARVRVKTWCLLNHVFWKVTVTITLLWTEQNKLEKLNWNQISITDVKRCFISLNDDKC